MNAQTNVKAISTLIVILLMIIAAIIGGIISYAFTIAYYNKMPQRTALTITDVYINKENVNSFIINVLNPSYSPADAKISRIAISLKDETQLYDVVETEPSIGNGINVPIGESVNITCLKIRRITQTLR
jgi:flagellar basal body-associated protein FliL